MTAASTLLKKQFPNINGMQSTLYITNQNKCITIGKEINSVQIVHQKERQHWVALEVLDQELYMYDSIQPKQPSIQIPMSTKQILNNLYKSRLTEYITTDITQQSGSVDCGLFAIANITAICHGQRPEKIRYNQSLMRQHVVKCLESGELVPFPGTKKKTV